MAQRSARLAILLAATTAIAQNCFWRSSGQIHAISWYACNNTRATPGGAQLCCIKNSQCGQDSICLKDNKYYVGGCTDGTYGDPVCRTSCSEDASTWIQWNQNTQAWECCGNNGCDGSPPTETFKAVARASWSPVEWVPPRTSSSSSSTPTSTTTAASHSTSTSHTSTSSNVTPTQTSQENDKAGRLSTAAQAGIGVACGLFGLAAILALVLVLMKKQKKRNASKPELHGEYTSGTPNLLDDQSGIPMMSQKYAPLGELNADQMKQEMPASAVDPVELEGSEHARGKR